jgi:hypothetical protein
MSGGGGKGGETKNELDPEMKAMAREVFNRGKTLSSTAPVPFQGLTMAAPSQATRQAWTNTNSAANALGLGMAGDPSDGLPEHEREMGGLRGYSSHRGYQQELQRAWREYPQQMQALNQLIPGLMNPIKTIQQNADWWKETPAARGGIRGLGGYNFDQIANMYRNRRGGF